MRFQSTPWLEQLQDREPRPLRDDVETDVAIVGAGIAGVATAFFLLRDTRARVVLVERDRLGHGATGHNAGQLASYFERPLCELVDDFGFERAIAAQGDLDRAWNLLDVMTAESGASSAVQRFQGHMGLFALNHLTVHLQNNLLRRRGGLDLEACVISEEAEFLAEIPRDFDGLYDVVPQRRVQELLDTRATHYRAVLSYRKGCGNSALLCQEVVDHLLEAHPDRFAFFDRTAVERVTLGERAARLSCGESRIRAARVVMCTNGFADHLVENACGAEIPTPIAHRVYGTVGFMAGWFEPEERAPAAISYVMSPRIGEGQAYFYLTRRPYVRDGRKGTLVCVGGPDERIDLLTDYERTREFPARHLAAIDAFMRATLPETSSEIHFDYAWHGIMAYTDRKVRLIGPEPRNPVLLYNLACNGVGFLPSIYGGHRIARFVQGETVEPSLFDPD